MSLILISGDRLQHAVSRATEAVERGEKMSTRLSRSVEMLRGKRDELQTKLVEARSRECPELEGIDWTQIFG
jgi:hypothetical protein